MILPGLDHHAYSKHAEVTVPSLDGWEKGWKEKLIDYTIKLHEAGPVSLRRFRQCATRRAITPWASAGESCVPNRSDAGAL